MPTSVGQFKKRLAQLGAATALARAPFGYCSSCVDGVYRFTITNGTLRGSSGEGATLEEAIANAVAGISVPARARNAEPKD